MTSNGTAPDLRGAVIALAGVAGPCRGDAALLAEAMPLHRVLSGGAALDAEYAARLLALAEHPGLRGRGLGGRLGEIHAAVLDLPVASSAWRLGSSEVHRRGGELVHRGAPPHRIGDLVSALDGRRRSGPDPISTAFETYAELQRIHPFDDGNGRVGRVALHLDLVSALGCDVPPVGLLLAAQGRAHEDALRSYRPGVPGPWLDHVDACLRRAAATAAAAAAPAAAGA